MPQLDRKKMYLSHFILKRLSLACVVSFAMLSWIKMFLNNRRSPYDPNVVNEDDYLWKWTNLDPRDSNFQYIPTLGLHVYTHSAIAAEDQAGNQATLVLGLWNRTLTVIPEFLCLQYSQGGHATVEKGQMQTIPQRDTQLLFTLHPVLLWCKEGSVSAEAAPSVVRISDQSSIGSIVVMNMEHKGKNATNQAKMPQGLSKAINIKQRRPHAALKNTVVVCTRQMYNYRSAQTFAEWMEMQRLMGANKVIIYDYRNVSAQVESLVDYYQKIGFLHVQPWKHTFTSSTNANRDADVLVDAQYLSNNDCLYRFGAEYEYLLMMDLDELLIPSRDTRAPQRYIKLIQYILNSAAKENSHQNAYLKFQLCHFCVSHYVWDSQDSELQIEKYTMRDSPHGLHTRTKFIAQGSKTSMVGVHTVIDTREKWSKFTQISVSPNIAKIHHYRKRFKSDQNICDIKDQSSERFVPDLRQRVESVLKQSSYVTPGNNNKL